MILSKKILIFVFTTIVLTSCVKENKDCPLMYKLNPSAFNVGLDSETCLLLSSLQNIASLYPALPTDPPVTIAAIRAQLETGQVSTFNDAAFDQFLNRLYSLDLDYSALNANEISVLNTIFEYLDPPANLSCCGGVGYPSTGADITMRFDPRVGSLTNEYSIELQLNNNFSCDIFDVWVNVSFALGGIPQTNPFVMQKLGCVDGKQTFKFLWLGFSATPVGGNYSFACDFRDSTGAILGSGVTVGWTP